MLMSDEFSKRLSAAKTRVERRKAAGRQEPGQGLADADRPQSEFHSAASVWNGAKAPIIKRAVEVANQELAESGVRLDTSEFSSFSREDMCFPGVRITVERLLAPPLPQQTGRRDLGALSPHDVAEAASITIALNQDGAVSIVPNNCNLSIKGVIPLNQFSEWQIETIVADFVDRLTSATAT